MTGGLDDTHPQPAFELWLEGDVPAVGVAGDVETSVLGELPLQDGSSRTALSTDRLAVALAVLVGLRATPHAPPVTATLDAAAMATVIGTRQAHGRGLPLTDAATLQEALDADARHWAVRLERADGLRRNLELLDTAHGMWRVTADAAGQRVTLRPTRSLLVLAALERLVALGVGRVGDLEPTDHDHDPQWRDEPVDDLGSLVLAWVRGDPEQRAAVERRLTAEQAAALGAHAAQLATNAVRRGRPLRLQQALATVALAHRVRPAADLTTLPETIHRAAADLRVDPATVVIAALDPVEPDVPEWLRAAPTSLTPARTAGDELARQLPDEDRGQSMS